MKERGTRNEATGTPNDVSPARETSPVTHLRLETVPAAAAKWLFAVSIALLLCNLLVHLSHYVLGRANLRGFAPMFDLNGEANVPALFSTLLLVSATILLALITSVKRRTRAPLSRHWRALVVIFAYLAIDEAAQVHEKVALNVADLIGTGGYPVFYAWVLPFAVFVGLVGLAYRPFLRALAPRFRRIFLLAGGIYVGSSLGLEVVDARYTSVYGFDNLSHHLLYSLEEVGEMWGVILFIYGLLAYLREEQVLVEAHFTRPRAT